MVVDLRSLDRAPFSARRVLLVGGGRWGRVYAAVLQDLLPPDGQIAWLTTHGADAARSLIARRTAGAKIEIFADIAKALSSKPEAGFIVSSPYDHYAHATAVLSAAVPVLVEKPLVLREAEAQSLVELATERRAMLAMGVHLMFASYLQHFHSLCRDRRVKTMLLQWCDPALETRYGETKHANHGVAIANDAFPHIWALLRLLLGEAPIEVKGADLAPEGARKVSLKIGATDVSVILSRRAPVRLRTVSMEFDDGGSATLDFATEPGFIEIDRKPQLPDSEWDTLSSPLTLQARGFLAALDDRSRAATWPGLADRVAETVPLAAEIASQIRRSDAQVLLANPPAEISQAILVDNLAPELSEQGLRGEAAERVLGEAISVWLRHAQPELLGSAHPALPDSRFLRLVRSMAR